MFLKNTSVSTSGCSEKCFWFRGRAYCHIIDPRTGWPAKAVKQVSVVAPQALESEVWAKACFINGRAWAQKHLPDGVRVFLFEADEDQAGTWL